jgi:uncharacterized protein (TIGR01319 family)
MEVVTVDDGKPTWTKVESTRHLRPDMVLIAGGTDGGSIPPVVQTAEILKIADPKARFGADYDLPVIYAGNKDAVSAIQNTIGKFALKIVDNIRPAVNMENSDPARSAIQELFMEHVMSHAPGYDKLMTWTEVPIMPTPMGEGMMLVQTTSKVYNMNVLGVGLGGATTNVYSNYDGKFVRTVSANLGMSYSICNVLKEATRENIMRWIPFDVEEADLVDILTNKMIRPTTIPQTLEELVIEHAVAREALRLGFGHHKFLARPLRGAIPLGTLDMIFNMRVVGLETYIDMFRVHLIGGTGGLLSHAPRRVQSALLLTDGFLPEGITYLIQDSVFMMPHLGVLSTVHQEAAFSVFDKDCVVRLGTVISPRGIPYKEEDREGEMLKVELNMSDGTLRTESLELGDIIRISLPETEMIDVKMTPHRELDMGPGPGKVFESKIQGGVAGILLDMRGRSRENFDALLPKDREEMKKLVLKWYRNLELYPKDALDEWEKESK